MGQQTVVVSGYYGFDNLGDEAVLYSMLKALKGAMPQLRIIVLSQNPGATAKTYGVESVDRWNLRQVARAIKRSDLLISGGGSLLQDVTGLKSLLYYLGVIRLAGHYGRPVVYYAQGIGPLGTGIGRRLVVGTTNKARAVTVRDQESQRDLQDLGVRKPITITADPVLGLHPGDIDLTRGAQILQRYHVTPHQSPVIGVAVRSWPGAGDWVDQLAKAMDLSVQSGRAAVLVPMQNPADMAVASEIAAKMQQNSVIISEKLTVEQMLSLIGNFHVLVGMRLHALIFAAICGVPPLGIVYDPKVERFLKRIHITPAGTPEQLQATSLANQIEHFLKHQKQIKQDMAPHVEQLRQDAMGSVQIVRECLSLSKNM